jgi:hypothetical protein
MDLRWPSCSSSGVGTGVDRHHRQRSSSVKGIHRGGVCGANAAHGAAHLAVAALPWMTPASGTEIGSPDGSGDSWWSVRPGNGGAAPGGSGDKGH